MRAHKFSGKAAEKIAAAGGAAETIGGGVRPRHGVDPWCRAPLTGCQMGKNDGQQPTQESAGRSPTCATACSSRSAMLGVYRIGNHIPTPGVNTNALQLLADAQKNTMFGLYDMFSGGNLSKVTIFALGIMPYISSSIILQLLTVVWPYLERLSREGELGRRKITQHTRYLTGVLAIVQAMSIAIFLERQTKLAGGLPLVYNPGWGFRLLDGADADDRHDLHHVARRADHRARRRQRHVAADLRRHRRRLPARRFCRRSTRCRRARSACSAILFLMVMMVVVVGGDHLRRTRPPADRRAARQARRRTPSVRRVEHAHPAEGEHRRRHPGDLRLVHPGVPGHAGHDVRRQADGARDRRPACLRHAALQPALHRRDYLLRILLHGDHLQPG